MYIKEFCPRDVFLELCFYPVALKVQRNVYFYNLFKMKFN